MSECRKCERRVKDKLATGLDFVSLLDSGLTLCRCWTREEALEPRRALLICAGKHVIRIAWFAPNTHSTDLVVRRDSQLFETLVVRGALHAWIIVGRDREGECISPSHRMTYCKAFAYLPRLSLSVRLRGYSTEYVFGILTQNSARLIAVGRFLSARW